MFCKNCGKEVSENAYVCIGCGCLVDRKPIRQKVKDTSVELEMERKPKKTLLFKLFLIISFSMACLALGACLCSIANLDYYYYQSTYSNYTAFYIYMNYDWAIVSWIFSVVGMGFGICTFIMGFKQKESFKMMAILNFVFTVGLFISLTLFIAFA